MATLNLTSVFFNRKKTNKMVADSHKNETEMQVVANKPHRHFAPSLKPGFASQFTRYYIFSLIITMFFISDSLLAQSVNLEATTSGQSNGTSLTFSHNRGTADNTLTLVSIQLGRQTQITGNVTYGGNNMTLVGESFEESGSGRRATV